MSDAGTATPFSFADTLHGDATGNVTVPQLTVMTGAAEFAVTMTVVVAEPVAVLPVTVADTTT